MSVPITYTGGTGWAVALIRSRGKGVKIKFGFNSFHAPGADFLMVPHARDTGTVVEPAYCVRQVTAVMSHVSYSLRVVT